jgi:hypothetical protein
MDFSNLPMNNICESVKTNLFKPNSSKKWGVWSNFCLKTGSIRWSSVDSTDGGSESTDEAKISTDGQNRAVATLLRTGDGSIKYKQLEKSSKTPKTCYRDDFIC